MRLGVIGVPYNSAGLTAGEARAPVALRGAGLIDELRRFVDVVDHGDVSITPPSPQRDPVAGIIAPKVLAEMIGTVRREVGRVLRDGCFPLVIGGECPLLLGCLAGACDVFGPIGLLFVDGHEDAWPPRDSETGEAADMELGFALGLTHPAADQNLTAMLPLVRIGDVIVLGPRDREELKTAGVPSLASVVTMLDDEALRTGDLAKTAGDLTTSLHANVGRWWFHLDLDVLATDALSAVRYPQPGGLAWTDLETLTSAALPTPGLVGWNVTIYNPDLDPDGRGAARIVSFLGAMARHLT